MKSLSPSGVELEIMTLSNFDLNGNSILLFLNCLETKIKQSLDTDYVHALLNCCLKVSFLLVILGSLWFYCEWYRTSWESSWDTQSVWDEVQ